MSNEPDDADWNPFEQASGVVAATRARDLSVGGEDPPGPAPVIDDILKTLSNFGNQTAAQLATVQQVLADASPLQIDLHNGIDVTVKLPGNINNPVTLMSNPTPALLSSNLTHGSPTNSRSRTGSKASISPANGASDGLPKKSETGTEMSNDSAESTPIQNATMNYYDDWRRLFSDQVDISLLYDVAVRSEAARCGRFRSVIWRVFLDVLPTQRSQWPARLAEQREIYESMRRDLLLNEDDLRASDSSQVSSEDDPLSLNRDSRWNRFFNDRELRAQIAQDVRRCMPEVQYFQEEAVQDRVLDILFLYCRKTGVPYRQGMHELLAPLLFATHFDSVMLIQAKESANQWHASGSCPGAPACDACSLQTDVLLDVLFDARYEEHDCYSLFATLMESVEPWYNVNSTAPGSFSFSSATAIKFPEPFESESGRRRLDLTNGPPSSNALGTKLTRIHDVLLKRCDAELHAHLDSHGIAVQLYGIRWLRLLFGREFVLTDLLVVWDTLFAEMNRQGGLDFIDWLFCALLIYIRSELLNSDVSDCLQSLMRYPRIDDVRDLIALAFHLREPQRFRRPQLLNERSSLGNGGAGTSAGNSSSVKEPVLPDWMKRGFSKKQSSTVRKGGADNESGESASSDSNLKRTASPKKGLVRTIARELQPIERTRSLNRSGAANQNEVDSELVRSNALETVFLIIANYVNQEDAALKTLQDLLKASGNQIENREQVDAAFDELRRVQIALKVTVTEFQPYLSEFSGIERQSTANNSN